ncbi:hypothetical protein FSP39_009565 [Pinctada imbricata]|uniref:Uncharacterized protein n=1 Tax=Pinctada imbricata TaxID=66713 RepID=A0AA88Y2Z3_PINIB|nr:hypothetical protein FSP39_009565 [Pinctada imbricata]
MDDKHIYIVCSDRGEIEKVEKAIGDRRLHFSKIGDGELRHYHDLVEIKRNISECEIVLAAINQTFNYNSKLQYELAIAILLEKDIAILSDGTPLSEGFDYDFFCVTDQIEDSRWAETFVEIINGRCTCNTERKTDGSRSKRDELLQFTWSIEEDVTTKQLAKYEMGIENADEMPVEADKVSHRLLCSLLTKSEENISTKVNRIPDEIKDLCKKYQKKITKCHIRQIGRQLELEDHHLDVVDTFYEHGIPEMFWQLVKIWHESYPDRVSARKLRKALKSCNINTEETHMPQKHKDILNEMTEYLVNNLVDIDILMPQLISGNVLDDRTKPYVTSPRTRDQRSMRLLEVLETKEHGMTMIIDVFNKTGHEFLSEKILERLPGLKEQTRRKPFLAVSPSPRSSCSSETSLKVTNNYVQFNSKDRNTQHRSNDRLQDFKSYSAPASLWTATDDKHSILDAQDSAIEFLMQDESNKNVHKSKRSLDEDVQLPLRGGGRRNQRQSRVGQLNLHDLGSDGKKGISYKTRLQSKSKTPKHPKGNKGGDLPQHQAAAPTPQQNLKTPNAKTQSRQAQEETRKGQGTSTQKTQLHQTQRTTQKPTRPIKRKTHIRNADLGRSFATGCGAKIDRKSEVKDRGEIVWIEMRYRVLENGQDWTALEIGEDMDLVDVLDT